MEKIINFEPLHISPTIAFLGTDEEIADAEEKERQAAAAIDQIIFDPKFIALEWREPSRQGDRRQILHHSTRPGIMFQLSYIDGGGVPAMHENYIRSGQLLNDCAIHTKEELLATISRKFMFDESLTLRVVTA